MRIWNLTPHVMHYDDGMLVRAFASDGILRLEQLTEISEPICGLCTATTKYGAVEGLPSGITEGDVLLVSTLVGDTWKPEDRPPGIIVLVPDSGSSCRRDAQGRIISVSRFIRK